MFLWSYCLRLSGAYSMRYEKRETLAPFDEMIWSESYVLALHLRDLWGDRFFQISGDDWNAKIRPGCYKTEVLGTSKLGQSLKKTLPSEEGRLVGKMREGSVRSHDEDVIPCQVTPLLQCAVPANLGHSTSGKGCVSSCAELLKSCMLISRQHRTNW